MKNNVIIYLLFYLLPSSVIFCQTDVSHFREGNKLYEDKQYDKSEIEYRKGLEKSKDSYTGRFNLANSLYKQGKYTEAAAVLDSLYKSTSNPKQKSSAYHNLGNALLKAEEYEQSIDAFKEALKLDPEAEDSRYNLSYAYKKLKKQQQQQQQQKNKEKDEKEQNEQKNDEQKKNEEQKQQEQKQDINRQEAERMLDALDRQEKKIRKEQEGKKNEPGLGGSGKDW